MKFKKHIVLIVIVLLIASMFAACKPSGDPKEFVESYYQNIKDNKFDTAYDSLSSESQKNYTKENFVLYQQLLDETRDFTSFTVKLVTENKKKTIDGVEYKNSDEFEVTLTSLNLYTNQEETNTCTVYAVNEDKQWKLYCGQEDSKTNFAQAYHQIGLMYFDGIGKTVDYNLAAENFNNGITASADYIYNYYDLARADISLKNYDGAQAQIDKFIQSATETNDQSDGYNVKGLCYLAAGDKTNAKAMFNKALELNPDNENAKSNLSALTK
jgi:tetratricopeptide (TPR) repeat protein